jgi:hypothetical protein
MMPSFDLGTSNPLAEAPMQPIRAWSQTSLVSNHERNSPVQTEFRPSGGQSSRAGHLEIAFGSDQLGPRSSLNRARWGSPNSRVTRGHLRSDHGLDDALAPVRAGAAPIFALCGRATLEPPYEDFRTARHPQLLSGTWPRWAGRWGGASRPRAAAGVAPLGPRSCF